MGTFIIREPGQKEYDDNAAMLREYLLKNKDSAKVEADLNYLAKGKGPLAFGGGGKKARSRRANAQMARVARELSPQAVANKTAYDKVAGRLKRGNRDIQRLQEIERISNQRDGLINRSMRGELKAMGVIDNNPAPLGSSAQSSNPQDENGQRKSLRQRIREQG